MKIEYSGFGTIPLTSWILKNPKYPPGYVPGAGLAKMAADAKLAQFKRDYPGLAAMFDDSEKMYDSEPKLFKSAAYKRHAHRCKTGLRFKSASGDSADLAYAATPGGAGANAATLIDATSKIVPPLPDPSTTHPDTSIAKATALNTLATGKQLPANTPHNIRQDIENAKDTLTVNQFNNDFLGPAAHVKNTDIHRNTQMAAFTAATVPSAASGLAKHPMIAPVFKPFQNRIPSTLLNAGKSVGLRFIPGVGWVTLGAEAGSYMLDRADNHRFNQNPGLYTWHNYSPERTWYQYFTASTTSDKMRTWVNLQPEETKQRILNDQQKKLEQQEQRKNRSWGQTLNDSMEAYGNSLRYQSR